jgi:hypothetical protein
MTSHRSQGVNPLTLKRQQEAEALRQQTEAQQSKKEVSALRARLSGSKSHLPINGNPTLNSTSNTCNSDLLQK